MIPVWVLYLFVYFLFGGFSLCLWGPNSEYHIIKNFRIHLFLFGLGWPFGFIFMIGMFIYWGILGGAELFSKLWKGK